MKPLQIENKDKANKLAQEITEDLILLRGELKTKRNRQLLKGNSLSLNQYIIKQNKAYKAFKDEMQARIGQAQEKALESLTSGLNDLKVNDETSKDTIIQTYSALASQSLQEYNSIFREIRLQSKVGGSLYMSIADMIRNHQTQQPVIYRDGKKFKLENYMEMRLRSDINNEVSNNFLQIADTMGQVFYICSEHGNCADDHIDYQGKIYCNPNWESFCPEDLKEQVADYIASNNIMSINDAMGEAGNYLTTRPNCRHYFQEISITSVLNITSDKKREEYLKESGMAYKTSYRANEYKYEQEQRYNERQIREWKDRLDEQKQIMSEMPKDISREDKLKLESERVYLSGKVRAWQERQRDLIKMHPTLDREYRRETRGKLLKSLGNATRNDGMYQDARTGKIYHKR